MKLCLSEVLLSGKNIKNGIEFRHLTLIEKCVEMGKKEYLSLAITRFPRSSLLWKKIISI